MSAAADKVRGLKVRKKMDSKIMENKESDREKAGGESADCENTGCGKPDNETADAFYQADMNDAIRHGMCVSMLAGELARKLGCDEEFVHKAAVAGMLHDIGKLQISPYIYGRQKHTMKIEEMRYVRLHAQLGADILAAEGYDDEIVDMVHYHHENYDGSGYPYRMQGEDIPLGARIIRVCDVFCALMSDRPYRKAFDPETAFVMVIDEVRHFDMKVFLAFQRMVNTTDVVSRVEAVLRGESKR